jgi:hypothetical protein
MGETRSDVEFLSWIPEEQKKVSKKNQRIRSKIRSFINQNLL